MPRPAGYRHSPEDRARISAGLLAAYAEGRGIKRGIRHRGCYHPPPDFAAMFDDFRRRYGAAEAERLVRDHAAVVARRQANKS